DSSPLHDTLVIAPAPAAIPGLEINYRSFDLQILGGAEGEALLDTNGDGAVTPIDALGVINQLNEFGSSAVAEGETAGLDRSFDVNRDSFVSPLDALEIINYLNEQALDMGEGEGIEIVGQSTIDTSVAGNEIAATEAVQADVIDEFLRVRENEIGLAYFTGGSQDVVEEDSSDLESTIDELADDVFGQW
ncbi:MAG: dockerin type I domain-containing protein, partial [Planctomycetota bacterium]|nr:dockerin type I domain-containing protein [Planctomycetota bacterium]